jgi:hypothetical protein
MRPAAIALAHTLVFVAHVFLFVDILWSVSGSVAVPGPTCMCPVISSARFVYAGISSVRLESGGHRPRDESVQSAEAPSGSACRARGALGRAH